MKQILKTILISGLYFGLVANGVFAQEHQHTEKKEKAELDNNGSSEQEDNGNDEGKDEATKISPEQMELANIKVARLETQIVNYRVYAPGEIKANGYTSYLVSPRVDSVVLRRHVALGDHVKKGQGLVTLFSETVAAAQANYSVTQAEWKRVQQMGRQAVGDRRFVAAQSEFKAAYGRLRAFGLSETVIQSLAKKIETLGEYTLVAEIDGAVLTDDFHQGQRVQSGDALMELADEKELWVEARLAPTLQLKLPSGTKAQVKVGDELFSAEVTQEAHIIDQETRTRVVRLIVNNKAHHLHSGLFADVYFSFMTDEPVLVVPETALMRAADGDWTIFIEDQAGQFKAQEVELGRFLGKWREITGVAAGSKVVIEGAFFVASEIAKGDFDTHNH